MIRSIRTALNGLLLVAIMAMAAGPSWSQTFPTKPLRLVVPLAAGGPTDAIARSFAQRLSDRLGQPVAVENKPGAGGMVGSEWVSKAAPDGYTMLLASAAIAIWPSLYSFDPESQLTGVTLVASGPLVLVVANDLRVKSIADLVALAKTRPGALTYGTGGPGTTTHLATELLRQQAGIDLVHVPYRGTAPAMTDLLGGRLSLMFDSLASVYPHIKAGRVTALGVTEIERSVLLPDVPTIRESGFRDYEVSVWYGLFVPKGASSSVVERLSLATREVTDSPEFAAWLANVGHKPLHLGTVEFAGLLHREVLRWKALVKSSGAKLN